MDILTILLSAFGGIILWNLFVPTKKNLNTCEAKTPAVQFNEDIKYLDLDRVRRALLNTFGTTNIPAALEYAKQLPDSNPDLDRVRRALLGTFGTTNLDFIIENYMSKGHDEQFKKQLQR
jgi:hypothetical protein